MHIRVQCALRGDALRRKEIPRQFSEFRDKRNLVGELDFIRVTLGIWYWLKIVLHPEAVIQHRTYTFRPQIQNTILCLEVYVHECI